MVKLEEETADGQQFKVEATSTYPDRYPTDALPVAVATGSFGISSIHEANEGSVCVDTDPFTVQVTVVVMLSALARRQKSNRMRLIRIFGFFGDKPASALASAPFIMLLYPRLALPVPGTRTGMRSWRFFWGASLAARRFARRCILEAGEAICQSQLYHPGKRWYSPLLLRIMGPRYRRLFYRHALARAKRLKRLGSWSQKTCSSSAVREKFSN